MEIVNLHQAEAWNGYEGKHWADNNEQYDTLVGGLSEHLFPAAAIGTDDRVLDIGCGSGQTTRTAAGLASRGRALGIDLSQPMLDRARLIAAEEQIGNVSFEQGDAQVYPFPAAAFDIAISRGGIMYFDDPVAAFANIRRALAPGGRLAFVCGRDSGTDEAGVIWRAMAEHVALPKPAEETAPGPVTFSGEAHITGVLAAAGFADITAEPQETASVYDPDPAIAAEFIFGMGPIRYWLSGQDADHVAAARQAVIAALQPFRGTGGIRVRSPYWLFTAVTKGN